LKEEERLYRRVVTFRRARGSHRPVSRHTYFDTCYACSDTVKRTCWGMAWRPCGVLEAPDIQSGYGHRQERPAGGD
jgi:hypothetical protein